MMIQVYVVGGCRRSFVAILQIYAASQVFVVCLACHLFFDFLWMSLFADVKSSINGGDYRGL